MSDRMIPPQDVPPQDVPPQDASLFQRQFRSQQQQQAQAPFRQQRQIQQAQPQQINQPQQQSAAPQQQQQPQQDQGLDRIEDVVMQDWYRSAPEEEQNKLKRLWLRDVAPKMYPGITRSPQASQQLSQRVFGMNVPDIQPDEERIVKPEVLQMDQWQNIKDNPSFANKSYEQQQKLKQVWYLKMSRNDQEFQQLSPEEQSNFYSRLMRSAPELSKEGHFVGNLVPGRDTGLFTSTLSDEYLADPESQSDLMQGITTFNTNLIGSFLDAFGSLITGPLRLLGGDDSPIAQTLDNIQKERQWINTTSDSSGFLTKTLPSLTGFVGGAALGPYSSFERLFSGSIKSIGAKGITSTPGLVGRALGKQSGNFATQVAGGTIAGGIQGISQAVSEGRHWSSYVAQDASFGFAFEIGSRYIGMLRGARRAAKSAGMDLKEFLDEPNRFSSEENMSEQLRESFRANPEMREYTQAMKVASENGLSADLMSSPEGVRMEAQILGFGMEDADDAIRLTKNGKLQAEFTGPKESQVEKAISWLDNNEEAWRAWENSRAGKSLMEAVSTQPELRARVGTQVPNEAREHILKTFKDYNITTGADYRLDPRASTDEVDTYFGMLRDQGADKASKSLRQRGIIFSEDPRENVTAIKQLKAELDYIAPKHPYIVTNSNTKSIIESQKVPVYLAEHPDIKNPFTSNRVLAGKPSDIQKYLNTIKKHRTTQSQQESRVAKQGNIDLYKFSEHDPVEMQIKVPDNQGNLHDALLHFPSVKQARQAMNTAKTRGMSSMMNELASGKSGRPLRESFKRFEKQIRKTDPNKGQNDFLPYRFLSEQAREQGYFLGAVHGKYILEDNVAKTPGWKEFDDLQSVSKFLRDTDGRGMRPDLAGPVSRDAMEDTAEAGGRDNLNPVDQVPFRDPGDPPQKRFGILSALRYKLMPTKYFMQELEKFPAVQQVANEFGFSPVRFYNAIQDATRLQNSWSDSWLREGARVTKGVRSAEMEHLWRYVQGFDTRAEYDEAVQNNKKTMYEFKDDVKSEMAQEFGQSRADFLTERGQEIHNYFNELFKHTGMNWGKFVKNYLPHISQEFNKADIGVSYNVDLRRFDAIPNQEKEEFFMMFRESDPRDVVWETDVNKLVNIYTNAVARQKFIRPTMQKAAEEMRNINEQMRAKGRVKDQDWAMATRYITDLMQTVNGIRGESDQVFQYATARTLDEVKKSVGQGLNVKTGPTKGSVDLVSGMIKLGVGAHLALRPYTLLRNLSQSLVTGGTLIGNQNWLEGIGRMQSPGAMRELFSNGIIDTKHMPVGGGHSEMAKDPISWAMKPYAGTDWINRGIMWYGMDSRVNKAANRYRSGKISQDRFLRESGSRLFSKPDFREAVRILNTSSNFEEALPGFKDRLKRLAVEESQFLYNRWDQPQAFRSGIGRFAGQYTSFPNTMWQFVRTRMTRGSAMTPLERVGFLARLSSSLGALSVGTYEAGLSPDEHLPWNMMMMQEGPYFQMLLDFSRGLGGSREAWSNMARNLTSLVPFSSAGEGVLRSIQAMRDGEMYEAFLHLASAPVRRDLYPKREVITDKLEKEIIGLGDQYVDFKWSGDEQVGETLRGNYQEQQQ